MSVTDKEIFDKFRAMSGGKLTQEQVDGLNAVIAAGHRADVIAAFAIGSNDVDMHVSLDGMKLIAGFEGFRDKAYRDIAGVPTLGFGTTRYPDGTPVKMGDTCTLEQALLWKKHDIEFFERHVNRIITVPLTQRQFDAVVSLVYNVGVAAFESGKVDDLINQGRLKEAVEVWAKYRNARNPKTKKLEVSQGLVNRRNAEIAYFTKK